MVRSPILTRVQIAAKHDHGDRRARARAHERRRVRSHQRPRCAPRSVWGVVGGAWPRVQHASRWFFGTAVALTPTAKLKITYAFIQIIIMMPSIMSSMMPSMTPSILITTGVHRSAAAARARALEPRRHLRGLGPFCLPVEGALTGGCGGCRWCALHLRIISARSQRAGDGH